jgi:hypothetical protein
MKCRCGAEIDFSSGYCALCDTRRPFAWICERCNQEVPWDHPTSLVCSTVCPDCGNPKPASPPLAVIPNCSAFGQFVLLAGATASILGCVGLVLAAIACLVERQWLHAFVTCPILFLLQAASVVVFLRMRALGREP